MLPDFSGLSLQCAPTGEVWPAANGSFPAAGAEWTPAQQTWLGDARCVVCLDALSNDASGPPLILCANRHVYHRDCAQYLVDRSYTRCPECSQPITTDLTPTPVSAAERQRRLGEMSMAEQEVELRREAFAAMEPWEREEREQREAFDRERYLRMLPERARAERRMFARHRRQRMRQNDRERGDRGERARVRERERVARDTPREHQPLRVYAP